MSLIKKYQLPVYDPPVLYNSFNGGINTSLSNESLQQNEIRDGLNCHYNNSAIVNRPGASLIKRLIIPMETNRYQGDFLYVGKSGSSWMISVRNGHIFYGLYSESENIEMSLLKINLVHTENFDDTENYLVNLATVNQGELDYTAEHEGFIYRYVASSGSGDGDIDPSEIPEDAEWEETLIIQNKRRVQGIPIDNYFLLATGTRILKIEEYNVNDTGQIILQGEILKAHKPNPWDYKLIGPSNLSPFPNYHITDVTEGTPQTEIGTILTEPKVISLDRESYKFKAFVGCLTGYDKSDFYYKWEVKIENKTDWKVLLYWNASKNTDNRSSKNVNEIEVTQEELTALLGELNVGDNLLIRCTLTTDFAQTFNVTDAVYIKQEDEAGDYVSDMAKAQYSKTHISCKIEDVYAPTINDVDQEFYNIHSCTKVIADGQKALFYDDKYNTGRWYKTVINNYEYITYNGSLSFKTTKNEAVTGVVVFDSNILVFADNPQLGGNISVVTGNGDDYNNGDYYSPYKRTIVNTGVSCDAFNTIQTADNYVIFKYRKDIYMLDTSSLSNSDTVKVNTINDMVKQRLNNIEFPLDRIRWPYDSEHLQYDFHELNQCLTPEEIFSEVVDGYYGLIFPNQGFFADTLNIPSIIDKYYEGSNEKYRDKRIEDISIKPGLRWKCYFRDGKQYQGISKVLYPWLRDVGYLFDICSILYIEGVPCFVRKNGDLIKFDRTDGVSYSGTQFKLRFKSKAYDMENPALCKFLDNACIYFNRDFDNIHYMNIWIHNEASYEIYGPENEAFITVKNGLFDQVRYTERLKFDDALNLREQDRPITKYEDEVYIDPMDKPVEILNTYEGVKNDQGEWINPVLNRPSFTSKTCTPRWRFPFLNAQLTIELRVNQAFSLSALNFSYTSSDMPDFTREKLYRDIIRDNYK